MVNIVLPTFSELPQDVKDELIGVMKTKLPVQVDDSIIDAIITEQLEIAKDYFLSLPKS